MKVKASELIAIAESQIGYKEKKSNKDLDDFTKNAGHNNFTKYSRDLYKAGFYNGNKQGYSWCAAFVDWCFYVACDYEKDLSGMKPTGLLGASCRYAKNYYKKQGRLYTAPEIGDQIFFQRDGEVCHTGLVADVTADRIITIEGNCGDCVKRVAYAKTDKHIDSFGRPDYKPEGADEELKIGDLIKLKSDATIYGKSKKFSSWVYDSLLYVRSVDGDKIGFSVFLVGDITGHTDRKYLTKL